MKSKIKRIGSILLAIILAVPVMGSGFTVKSKAQTEYSADEETRLAEYRSFVEDQSSFNIEKDVDVAGMSIRIYDNGSKGIVNLPAGITNGTLNITTPLSSSEIDELQKIKCLVFGDGVTGFDYVGESPLFLPEYVYLPVTFATYGTGITTADNNNSLKVLAIDGSEHITELNSKAVFNNAEIMQLSLTGFEEIPDGFLSFANTTIDNLDLSNVKKVGKEAFYSIGLKNVTGLAAEIIGDCAFYCTKNAEYNDTERYISADYSNTITIGAGSFKNCSINNQGNMSDVLVINDTAFENCSFTNTDIDLPNTRFVGQSAFSKSNIENVYLPVATIVGISSSSPAVNTDDYTLNQSWINENYADGDLGRSSSQWGLHATINTGAFSNCNALKRLYMPSSLYFNEVNLPALTDIWIGDNLINKGSSGFIAAVFENGSYSDTNLKLHTNSELIRDNKTVNIVIRNDGTHNDYDTIDAGCGGSSGSSSSSGYGNTGKITLVDNAGVTGATPAVSTQYGNGTIQFVAASNLYGLPFTQYANTSWTYDGFRYSNMVSFPDGLVRAISVPADAGRSAFTTITLNVSNLSETDKNALINSTYGYTKTIYKELEISGSYTVDYASSDDTVKASLSDIKTTSTKQISGDYNTGTKIGHYITFDVPAGVDATNIGSCQLYHKNTEGTFEIVTNIAKDISDSKVKIYSPDVEFEIGTYAFTSGDIANSYDVVTVHEYNNTELNRTSEQISYNSNKTITNSDVRMTGYKLDSISYVTNNGTPTTATVGTPFKILGNTTITIKYIKSPTVTLKCVDNDGNQIHSETKNTYAYSSTQYRYDFEETPDIEGYIYDENASYVNSSGDTITLEIDDSVYITSDITDITITLVYKKLPKVTRIDKYEDTILGSESDIDVDYDGSYYFSPATYAGYEFVSASYQDNGTTKTLTSSQWIYPDSNITITSTYKKIKSATIIDMYRDTELGRRTINATTVTQGDRINFTTQTYSGYYVTSATYTLNDGTECGVISTGYNYITEDIIITVQYDICPVIRFVEILNGVETLKSTITATSASCSYTPQPRDDYYVDETFIVNDNTSVVLNYDSYYPTIVVTNYDTKDITIKYNYIPTTNIVFTVIDRNCITGEDVIRSGYNALSTTSGNLVRAIAYWPSSDYRPYKVTITNDEGEEKSFEATLGNQYLPVRATENCTIVYEYRTIPELKVLHKVGTTTVKESSSYRQINGGSCANYYLSDSELSSYGYSNYILTNIVINSAQTDANCFEILQAGPDADKNKMVRVGNTQPLWEDATITFYYKENCEWKLVNISIITPPDRTEYTDGEEFNPAGMEVEGTYSKFIDGVDTGVSEKRPVTDYITDKGILHENDTKVIVSYENKTANQPVTVRLPIITWKLESIEIVTPPDKINYIAGEEFDKSGMKVEATYHKYVDGADTGVSEKRSVTDYTTNKGTLHENDTNVIVSYEDKTANQPVTVRMPVITWKLESIEIVTPPDRTKYTDGEEFNPEGMEVEGTYSKFIDGVDIGVSEKKPVTDYITDKGILHENDTKVIVSYENKTAEQPVAVTSKSVCVEGTLKDERGTPLANHKIELHSVVRTAVTDANGFYKFENVAAGEHSLYVFDEHNTIIGTVAIHAATDNSSAIVKDAANISFDITVSDNINSNVISINGNLNKSEPDINPDIPTTQENSDTDVTQKSYPKSKELHMFNVNIELLADNVAVDQVTWINGMPEASVNGKTQYQLVIGENYEVAVYEVNSNCYINLTIKNGIPNKTAGNLDMDYMIENENLYITVSRISNNPAVITPDTGDKGAIGVIILLIVSMTIFYIDAFRKYRKSKSKEKK